MDVKRGKRLLFILLAVACLVFSSACGEEPPQEHVDLSDPVGGDGIYTTAELLNFIERGESNTATLGAAIDLGSEILRITKERGPITIVGNGFSITGNADCLIRLEDGASLRLEEISLNAGRNGLGCLGDATLGGNAEISSVAHCIVCVGDLSVLENSAFQLASNVGSGIKAKGLELLPGSEVIAEGALGGISIAQDDLILCEGASLSAITEENYNALKCEGTLVLREGALLRVTNNGEYHGAEIHDLSVEGVASVEATGGSKGVGIFLFEQEEDVYLVGSCTPELRFEVGNGNVTFVESADDMPNPELEEDAEAEETEGQEGGEAETEGS